MIRRALRNKVSTPRQVHGNGFAVAQLHPSQIGGGMNPFIQVDAFSLSEPFFAPHPHAGFSAVTYIFPESRRGFINRDTLGSHVRIPPGALHWTAAGKGIQHEEVPEQRGDAVFGWQMFIKLPAERELADPFAIHVEPEEMVKLEGDRAEAKVVFGRLAHTPAADLPTPGAFLLDVTLRAEALLEVPLEEGANAFGWLFSGQATILEDEEKRSELGLWDFFGLESNGGTLVLRGGSTGARLLVGGGRPLQEPIVSYGPFAMSTETRLRQAMTDYQAGRMGSLSKSHYDPDGNPQA